MSDQPAPQFYEAMPHPPMTATTFHPQDMIEVQEKVAQIYKRLDQAGGLPIIVPLDQILSAFPDLPVADAEILADAPATIIALLKEVNRLGVLYGSHRHHHLQANQAMEQMAADRQKADNHLAEVAETRNFWKKKGAQIEALLDERGVTGVAGKPRMSTADAHMLAQIRDILNEGRA